MTRTSICLGHLNGLSPGMDVITSLDGDLAQSLPSELQGFLETAPWNKHHLLGWTGLLGWVLGPKNRSLT